MREIKFRVWSTVSGSYDYFSIQEALLIDVSRIGNKAIDEDFIFEQFTGLYDKKGREIYEGDIVCITDYHDGDFYMSGVVKFGFNGYPAFEIYGRKNQTYSDEYNSMTNDDLSLEVIGNIHENPDLLDG